MAPPTASLVAGSRLRVLVFCLLALGNVPTKALADTAGIDSSALITPIELPARAFGRSLAQANLGDSPAKHCVTKVTQFFGPQPCASSNSCPASAPTGVMMYSGTGVAAGSVVPGVTSLADCCTKCSEQKATCGGYQFVLNNDLGSTGCHLLTATDCDAVDAFATSFNPTLGFDGPPPGFVAAFCPPQAPVLTPECKSVTLTAGPSCTAPTPSASDVYVGLTSDLASDVTLDQLIIDGDENPPATLVVGVHNYTLTASNRLAASAPCQKIITVLPSTTNVPTPQCNPTTAFLAATSGCAHPPPTVADLYVGDPNFPFPMEVAIYGNLSPLESLLVGQEYVYSLTAVSCGVRSAPCNTRVIVRDTEPLDGNLIACPGVSTITTSPATFTATYLGGSTKANGCPVTVTIPTYPGGSPVTCDLCKKGRRETPNCLATASGNTLTVTKNGGAGNRISWIVKAADAGPKSVETTCGVCVESQGKKGACVGNWTPGEPAPCL